MVALIPPKDNQGVGTPSVGTGAHGGGDAQ